MDLEATRYYFVARDLSSNLYKDLLFPLLIMVGFGRDPLYEFSWIFNEGLEIHGFILVM